MNFERLVDFNKYTLAIAAGGLLYTLETFVPSEAPAVRWAVLALLVLFIASAVTGVLLFAQCTKAMHGDESSKAYVKKNSPTLGTLHAALLALSLIGLGALLVPRVLAAPSPPAPIVVNCLPGASNR